MRPFAAIMFITSFAALVAVLAASPGCGGPTASVPGASGATTEATATSSSVPPETVSTLPSRQEVPGDVQQAFTSLALRLEPMAVFVPGFLPEGAVLAESWWPIVEWESPETYPGSPRPNPLVMEQDSPPQAELIIRSGDGWLDFLQNFRGDVGETPGRDVGLVAGVPAALFHIAGGTLVQWQHAGLWYGIFARDVPEQEVLRIARGMIMIRRGESE